MGHKRNFTNEELNDMKNLYLDNISITNIALKYNTTFQTVQNRLKEMNIFKYKNRKWNKNDIDFLIQNYSDVDWNIILDRLSKWSKPEIISKASALGLKREIYFWSDNDIKILKKAYEQKISLKEIVKLLNYKFSELSISTKAGKLGLSMREFWTDDEDELLKEVYHKYEMDKICELFPNRNRDSIIHHAMLLGLNSKNIWTHEEHKFLIDNYNTMSDKEIGEILNKKPRAIQTKRLASGLIRPINKGLYNYLSEYIRKRNKDWKIKSAKNCNYKCVITGQRFNEIHHLYGMNMILEETLSDLGYVKNIDINSLSESDLNIILNHFYEVQNNYPLGICLTQNIHKEFHDCYGYGNNTPEQFEEFLKDKNYQIKIA